VQLYLIQHPIAYSRFLALSSYCHHALSSPAASQLWLLVLALACHQLADQRDEMQHDEVAWLLEFQNLSSVSLRFRRSFLTESFRCG
jgi:hypothetical protein